MWLRDKAYKVNPEMNKWQLGVLHVVNICFVIAFVAYALFVGNPSKIGNQIMEIMGSYHIFGIILTCRVGDLKADANGAQFFIVQNYHVFGTMMTIAGSFNIVMGLIGIYCTLRNNFAIFSYSYCIILMLIALLLLATIILGEDLNSFAEQEMSWVMNISMYNYNVQHLEVANAWDAMQRQFYCCGYEGPLDWIKIINGLPITCCQIPTTTLDEFSCSAVESNKNLYRAGCMSELLEFVRAGVTNLAAIGIGFFVCQVIFLLIIFLFGSSFRERRKRDSRGIIGQNNLSKPQNPIRCLIITEDKSASVYF